MGSRRNRPDKYGASSEQALQVKRTAEVEAAVGYLKKCELEHPGATHYGPYAHFAGFKQLEKARYIVQGHGMGCFRLTPRWPDLVAEWARQDRRAP